MQKALGFLSENRTLQSKLQMAEVVQRQAHSAEQDYEEVIHLLEAEIAELKMQLAGKKAKHVSEIEVTQLLSLGKSPRPFRLFCCGFTESWDDLGQKGP